MPRFVTRTQEGAVPESPEALFRTLRPTDGAVRHLWAHQADLLREYQSLETAESDIALELPTGGGKTMVGLLLAEYRRQVHSQRVAYLCPNIQLARQAAAKATGYGIPAVNLTGPQARYDLTDFRSFQRAQCIAVTTYNGVFNSNPRIDSAQTLVLDDAHAGEGPVAELWAVEASRDDGALYAALLANLIDALPAPFAERMRDEELEPWRRNEVELVPLGAVSTRADVLREAITTHASGHNAFSGGEISDSLGHCLVYVSWNEILIRPLIPPTADHEPFAGAEQRIYMSATLGSGGELERAFGVPQIERLPVPPGWDEHGSGRRFFLFPGAARESAEVDTFIKEAISRAGRALVLTPSWHELSRFGSACLPENTSRVQARDIESGFDAFTSEDRAALLLANRYDGIDLPDESCRLIVISGLPAATHLQERFLYEKLRARRVLAERIRTRIVQGAGRCTRNPQDFAAIVMRGDRLIDFCARDEHLRPMHPELQAEINFGLDNSEAADDQLEQFLASFLNQDEDWREADVYIRGRIGEMNRETSADADQLSSAAEREVEAWRELWRGDLRQAVTLAQEVVDRLGGGDELRPYRSLWLYFSASWAAELAGETGSVSDQSLATELVREMEACARPLAWMPRIQPQATVPMAGSEHNERTARAASYLQNLGIRGQAFERKLEEIEGQLNQNQATQYELGLTALGEMLGFDAVRPGGQANPDSAWKDSERLWLLFEAKTEALPNNSVSASEVRQATTHHEWVRNELGWPDPVSSLTIIVSHKQQVDQNAAAIAAEVRLLSPGDVADIAARTFSVHREIRARARGLSDEQMELAFAEAFRSTNLDTDELVSQLGARRIANG